MRITPTTTRGRRMLGGRGAMPGDKAESSRQQRVPYRKAERGILGSSLRMETGTLYEVLGRMYDDLFTQNKETRPLQDCAGTGGNRGKRRNGETTQWTI